MFSPNQTSASIPFIPQQTSATPIQFPTTLPMMNYSTSYQAPQINQSFFPQPATQAPQMMQFMPQPQGQFTFVQAPLLPQGNTVTSAGAPLQISTVPFQTVQPAPAPQQFAPIVLHFFQQPHFDKLFNTLKKSFFAIDASVMGSGKTILASKLSLDSGLPIIVVAPPGAKPVWYSILNKYGVHYKIFNDGPVMTYSALSGTTQYQPSHGFLTRYEHNMSTEEHPMMETIFQPTPLLDRYIDEGVLFVFDEAHNLKNSSSERHKAAQAIIKRIYARGGRSKFLLVSGTPLDKPEQVKNYLKLVGFVQHRQAYTITAGRAVMKGIDELNQWALRLNPEKAKVFMAVRLHPPPHNKSQAEKYMVDMFLEVFKPVLMSVMIPPENTVSNKDIKNGFYIIDEEHRQAYEDAVNKVIRSTQFDITTGQAARPIITGDITTSLRLAQTAKAKTMARVARYLLTTPDERGNWRKVLLYAEYTEPIDIMMSELRDFNPLRLDGKVNQNKRAEIVAKFQVPSGSEHRLLISHPDVGGIAISLHDLTGQYPRWLLMMADYHAIRNLQTANRIIRDGMKGVGHVRFFYIKSQLPERSLLSSLETKGVFMSDLLAEQKEGGQLFANDYESEVEGVDIPELVLPSGPSEPAAHSSSSSSTNTPSSSLLSS